ncbi:MAG TPA: FAD-binding oxidoreductase [Stellaceae bacterium]|jgi:glycine/D-amino acid oxidase-like deaminating enzyme
MQPSFEAAVVGGGIIGATMAAALVDGGIRTVLIDRGACGGQGASRYSEGIVRLYDPDADIMALAASSGDCLGSTRFGRVFDPTIKRGGVIYADAPSAADALGKAATQYSSNEYPMGLLAGDDVRRVTNFLDARPDRVVLYEPRGGASDVRASVRLMANFVRSGGGAVLENAWVKHVGREKGGARLILNQGAIDAEIVVLAAGAWSASLLPELGLHTRTIPLVRLFASRPLSLPVIDIVAGTYAVPLAGNLVHVGVGPQVRQAASMPEELGPPLGGEDRDALRRLSELSGRQENGPVFDVLPGLDSYTADGRPAIGFLGEDDPRYVAAGLSGIGYKLAPGIALHAARQIAERLGRRPPAAGREDLLAPFAPGRLSGSATPRSSEVA